MHFLQILVYWTIAVSVLPVVELAALSGAYRLRLTKSQYEWVAVVAACAWMVVAILLCVTVFSS